MSLRTVVLLTLLLVLLLLPFRFTIKLWVKDNWEYFLWISDLWKAPKYRDSNSLDTTSPLLSQSRRGGKEVCVTNCSWEWTMSNSDYLSIWPQEPKFQLNDTEVVYPLKDTLACMPTTFGYSEAQGNLTFPHYGYPKCSSLVSDPTPKLHLDTTHNLLTITCPNTTSYPRIVLGPPDTRKLTMRREIDDHWEVLQNPVSPLPTQSFHEFAFGTCDRNREFFDQATYILRPNETEYQSTLRKMKELAPANPQKPFIVMLLVIDSYSRKHFYRKMPLTAAYLNSLNHGSQYKVFDFKLHNIIGGNSVANQIPILSLKPSIDDFNPNQDFTGNSSLWSVFKSKGFMTYFGFEDCDDSFPRKIGRMPRVDHTTNQFYCAVYKFTDCRMSKSSQKQRCIGPHMSHYYLLNYTYQFTNAYLKANQWLYLHLSAAHEASGQHAETLDSDLRDYLKTYLEVYSHSHEVMIMVEADHGMRYGDWYSDIQAFQENRLPVFFVIGSRKVLDEIPGVYDTLRHNSYRLNSKLDMRRTMLYLAELPYKQVTLPKEFDAVNLFTEKIRDNRTCEEISIPAWHCSCLELQPINLTETWSEEMGHVLRLLANHAVSLFNEEAYAIQYAFKGNLCVKLHLNRIEAAYGVRLSTMTEELKLELSVQESASFRIEVTFLVTSSHRDTEDASQSLLRLIYNGYYKTALLLTSMRLDRYVGSCEVAARAVDINPEYCVCASGFST